MGIAESIDRIRAAGFAIEADGDNLMVEPFSTLSDAQLGWLKCNKAEILAALLDAGQAGADHLPANDHHRASVDHLPLRLKAAAVRVCIETHGDGPEAIEEMLLDLTASPAEDWDRLTAHFEAQLSDPPPPDPGRTRVHFRDFALDDGSRVAFDADVPLDRLDALRAAGHDVVVMDAAEHRPANGAVRCADCGHSTLDGGIAHCGAGVDSGLATGGYWHADAHPCDRFEVRA